jgi:TP901 family phage tail tape measure protein
MIEAYEIGVTLTLKNNVSTTLTTISNRIKSVNAQLDRLQLRLNSLDISALQAMAALDFSNLSALQNLRYARSVGPIYERGARSSGIPMNAVSYATGQAIAAQGGGFNYGTGRGSGGGGGRAGGGGGFNYGTGRAVGAAAAGTRFNGIGTPYILAGEAATAGVVYSIAKAAQMQQDMFVVGLKTGASQAMLSSLTQEIEQTAAITSFSPQQGAGIAKILATSTSLTTPQIQNILGAVMRFADVQRLLGKTENPYESAGMAVDISHLFGLYTDQEIDPFLAKLSAVSAQIRQPTSALENALKYEAGTGNQLGVDKFTQLYYLAALARLGISGTAAGRGLADFWNRTMPGIFGSGLLTGKSGKALNDIGFVGAGGINNAFVNGNFSPDKARQILVDYNQRLITQDKGDMGKVRVQEAKDFQQAFGTIGGRIAKYVMTGQMGTALQQIEQSSAGMPTTQEMQEMSMNTLTIQKWRRTESLMDALATTIGTKLLPATNVLLDGIDKLLSALNSFLNLSPSQMIMHLGRDAVNYFSGGTFNRYFPPSSSSPTVQVNTQVHMDGQKVANIVSTHQSNQMSAPSSGSSLHNPTLSYLDVALPFSP